MSIVECKKKSKEYSKNQCSYEDFTYSGGRISEIDDDEIDSYFILSTPES